MGGFVCHAADMAHTTEKVNDTVISDKQALNLPAEINKIIHFHFCAIHPSVQRRTEVGKRHETKKESENRRLPTFHAGQSTAVFRSDGVRFFSTSVTFSTMARLRFGRCTKFT